MNNAKESSERIINTEEERNLDQEKTREIDDVKRNIEDTILEFHNYVFPKYIDNYKKYLGFVAERL
jgi:hypothetical protein